MQGLTEDGRRIVEAAASRHGVSTDAVYSLLLALVAGGGRQAQFSHPDLGGMGQWSQGGMIMVGDMFNNALKYRVDALCNELAVAVQGQAVFAAAPMSSQSQSQSSGMGGMSSMNSMNGMGGGVSLFVPGTFGNANRWPAELGAPSSVGSQNDLHYAVFPSTRRLAIEQGGRLTVYDIGDHQISGFSQQQSGDQSLTFTSQHGLVRVADLKPVSLGATAAPEAPTATPAASIFEPAAADPPPTVDAPASPAGSGLPPGASDDEIFSRIERLAELRKKDIITAEEFDAKKAELLARL